MTAPNPEQMKLGIAGLFSRAAPEYDQIGPRFFAHFGRRLVEVAQITAGEHVLDVATGRGAALFPAAARVGAGGRIVGIDIAQGMVDETSASIRGMGLANAQAQRMDAENLDFGDACFDAVLCGFAVFFFPNAHAALAEFRRVLKPGGRLAISTWGRDDERWAWLGDLRQKYAPAQFRQPAGAGNDFKQPEAMRALFQENGFPSAVCVEEDFEFFYGSEEQWMAIQWAHGMRYLLEQASPAALEQMRAEAFEHLRSQRGQAGIPHRLGVLYTVGTKCR